MVEATLDDLGIPGYAEVIPDIESVDYGRDVGYRVRQLAPDGCPQISGTAIRAAICNGDEAGWISVVTHTVAQIIKRGRNDPKYPLLA
jgi:predicted nucleotidyltransferase